MIQTLYPVNDYFTSIVDTRTGSSLYYHKNQNEGFRHRQDIITVDPIHRKARYRKFDEDQKVKRDITYDVPERVSDPLSVIYLMRMVNIEDITNNLEINVLNNKRLSSAVVNRMDDVSKSVPAGRFDCYDLKVDTQYEGLFKEAPDNEAHVYLEKETMTLIQGSVSIAPLGSIQVVLSKWEHGELPEN